MRVGKKPKVVEAKKTRQCFVLLEKATLKKSIANKTHKVLRSSTGTGPSTVTLRNAAKTTPEKRRLSGPIKKRPITTQISASPPKVPTKSKNIVSTYNTITNTTTTNNNNSSNQDKMNKSKSIIVARITQSPPPTIAASRSRRSIKPNPKYANEEFVGTIATESPSSNRKSTVSGKHRDYSNDLIDSDYFNKISDENDIDDDDSDDAEDHTFEPPPRNASYDDEYEDNLSEVEMIANQIDKVPKRRGRPPKNSITPQSKLSLMRTAASASLPSRSTPKSTPTQATKSSNITKSTPTQLQQMRKSMAANITRSGGNATGTPTASRPVGRPVGRPPSLSVGIKRKLDDSIENENVVTRKRFLMSGHSSETKPTTTAAANNNNKMSPTNNSATKTTSYVVRRTLPVRTLNGNKLVATTNASNNNNSSSSNSSNNMTTPTTSPARIGVAQKTLTASADGKRQIIISKLASNQSKDGTQPATYRKISPVKIIGSNVHKTPQQQQYQQQQQQQQQQQRNIAVQSTTPRQTIKLSSVSNKVVRTQPLEDDDVDEAHNDEVGMHIDEDEDAISTVGHTSKLQKRTALNTDDFETMPTFTIVNINDIINKKGDVLISQSSQNKKPTMVTKNATVIKPGTPTSTFSPGATGKQTAIVTPSPPKIISGSQLRRVPIGTTPNNKLVATTATAAATKRQQMLSATKQQQQQQQQQQHQQIMNNNNNNRQVMKPAPRILNSMVGRKTQPIKPLMNPNMLDASSDDIYPLSSFNEEDDENDNNDNNNDNVNENVNENDEEDDDNVEEDDDDDEDYVVDPDENDNLNDDEDFVVGKTSSTKKRNVGKKQAGNTSIAAGRKLTQSIRNSTAADVKNDSVFKTPKLPVTRATKENSLAATNQRAPRQVGRRPVNQKQQIQQQQQQHQQQQQQRQSPPRRKVTEQVVVSHEGGRIVKKITCYEKWYVIKPPMEYKLPIRCILDIPLIELANVAEELMLPSDSWSSKVTLFQLSTQALTGSTKYVTYTGDLTTHNISEDERHKYQPSCILFRRTVTDRNKSKLPYDRAVIFKNKTFYTNIEGKHVRLVGAPQIVKSQHDVEILLQIIDDVSLQNPLVELVTSTMQ